MIPPNDLIGHAGRWLDAELGGRPIPALLVVIGLGHGYLLEALERRGLETRVLALEPDPVAAHAFLARRDWTPWRTTGRLTYLVDPDYSGADGAWRMFPPRIDDHKVLVEATVARHGGDGATRAARVLKRIVFGARANADARRRFAPRYLTNSIRNAPALVAGSDVRALANVFRGVPAVIAAAGPSLDHSLDDLRELSDRGLLIATDTALRPLLDRGLAPPLVVGVDPGARNARHFQALPDCRDTWLVTESALDPDAVRTFGDRTFWFRVANHEPWPWYQEIGIDVGRIEVWGSVLTAAFQVAMLAGCDPIVLVGADLSFTDGRPYARGTTYELDWGYSTAIGAGLERAWQMQTSMFERVDVPDLHGAQTSTSPPLQAFRDWMVTHAARSGRRVINATGAGILFGEGVEQSSLRAVLSQRSPVRSLKTLARRAPSKGARRTVAARFREVQRTIDRLAKPAAAGTSTSSMTLIARWAEFSGDPFDAIAVGAALHAAALTLEMPESGADGSCGDTQVWPVLARLRARDSILRQLPEAIARLRAALNGVQPLPALGAASNAEPGDDTAALSAALNLLGPLSAAVLNFVEDPAAPLARQGVGCTPVSGLCAWPAEIAWPMQLFEALLGKACVSSSAAEDSFFSRPVVIRDRNRMQETQSTPDPSETVSDATRICARLALEWLFCASRQTQRAVPGKGRLLGMMRALEGSVQSTDRVDLWDIGSTLRLCLKAEDRFQIPDLPALPLDERMLARTMTGALELRVVRPGRTISDRRAASSTTRLVTPRVLTDEGLRRSTIAYEGAGGVVCVGIHHLESFVVFEDGTTRPHHAWPRPIIGELPFGADGVVAWNNGTANWPEIEPGCVMYRTSSSDDVIVEALPFRPTSGAWWRDRLYWTCFPSGVGSWAPGDSAFALPDLSLRAISHDDMGLLLEPLARGEHHESLRRLPAHSWKWQIGRDPEAQKVGPLGSASCRSTGHGWTAVGHSEADVVLLESADGRSVAMTCYYPLALAWTGKSLLVCTIGQELLLFEGLSDVLASWAA